MIGEVAAQVVQRVHVPAERDHPGPVGDVGGAAEVAIHRDEVDRTGHVRTLQRRRDTGLQLGRDLAEEAAETEKKAEQDSLDAEAG